VTGPVGGPLVSVWLGDDDPQYREGPWRVLYGAALRSGWAVESLYTRSATPLRDRGMERLYDALSLRMTRTRGGVIRRVVAYWVRPVWPMLGRTRVDDGGRQGEGRATNVGKTWVWRPPMILPAEPLPTCAWKYEAGWTWTSADRGLVSCAAAEVRRLLTDA
jgi:hypothetical protein